MNIVTILKNTANKVSSFVSSIWSSVTAFVTKVYKKVSGQQAREEAAAIEAYNDAFAMAKYLRMQEAEQLLKAEAEKSWQAHLAYWADLEAKYAARMAAQENAVAKMRPILAEFKSSDKVAEIKRAEFYRTPEGILFHKKKMSTALNVLAGLAFVAATTSGFFARQNLKP